MTEENKDQFNMSTQKSSQSSFDYAYNQYFTPLFRYILGQTKNKETAEDLVQIVFLKTLKKHRNSSLTQLPPLPYFFVIARNTIIDYWKKKKEITMDISEMTFATLIDEEVNPQEKLEKELASSELQRALEKLSYEQKEVLTLRFISDLSNKEISATLGKTEEAIRQIQYRAIKNLRETMKKYD